MRQVLHRASVGRFTSDLPISLHLSGLGDATTGQVVGQVGSAVGPVVTAAAAPAVASILAGSGTATAATLGLAAGLVGVAFTGVLVAVEAILNSGCGQSCVVTSQWANQAEPILQQNLDTYFALPAPRNSLQQQSALNMFDAVWGKLVQLCSQAGLSTAGRNCIADRQAGACKWNQTAPTPQYPGQPAYGQCWNWFNAYRDPIAQDPIQDTPSNLLTSVGSSLGVDPSTLLLIGGGALLVLGAMGN